MHILNKVSPEILNANLILYLFILLLFIILYYYNCYRYNNITIKNTQFNNEPATDIKTIHFHHCGLRYKYLSKPQI